MPDPDLTKQARTRLRRIEGQVRGIQGMLDDMADDCSEPDSEPCDGLLTQILAVRAAVEQVGLIIMQLHLQRCVLADLSLDEEKLRDLGETLKLWSRLSSAPR